MTIQISKPVSRTITSEADVESLAGVDFITLQELALSGAGSPHNQVVGRLGQLYLDTSNRILYICASNPSGKSWWVV